MSGMRPTDGDAISIAGDRHGMSKVLTGVTALNVGAHLQPCICLRKEFKHFSGTIEHDEIEYDNPIEEFINATMNIEFLVGSLSNTTNIYEEILIFDGIGLVGSLGGSLGLFVGFSFFGYVTPILDAIFEKVADFFNI